MNPESYRRQKELFVEALARPVGERAAFLDRACGDDPELREGVESLLAHHHPETLIGSSSDDGSSRSTPLSLAGGLGGLLRRALRSRGAWGATAGLALMALGVWTHVRLERSVRELRGDQLTALLQTEVAAIDAWIDQEKRRMEEWAAHPRVRQLAATLLAERDATPEELRLNPARDELLQTIAPWLGADSSSQAIIDDRGIVYGSRHNEEGLRLTGAALGYLARVLRGETVFVPPHRADQMGVYEAPLTGGNTFTYTFTAIRDPQGRAIGALGMSRRATGAFSSLLKAAFLGQTGETYAFDERGGMLSSSRFADELREVELLSADTHDPSLELRDPGRVLRPGEPLPEDLGARPLTRLIALALANRQTSGPPVTGVVLAPYRNYRGVEVIGAWAWLPQHDFGVATELQLDEALGPLRPLEATFGALFAVLVGVAGVAVVSALQARRLRRRLRLQRRLGQHAIERRLGVGGMGEVYLARHATLERPTAVKVIRADRLSAETLERFEREVRVASRLSHPNTIEIYDFGRAEDGTFYYAMEYVDGPDLAELVAAGGAVPPARAIHILRQVCGSLREAHETGLVHRDVKPHNIMLCERGGEPDVVKVLDFGLAKSLEADQSIGAASLQGVRGSPLYMAPERLENPLQTDARADIYSLGAVAFELLAGRPILEPGGSDLDVIYRVVEQGPRPLREVAPGPIPEDLERLVMRCLARDPADRPSEVAKVLAELAALATRLPWSRDEARAWWQAYRGVA